MVNDKDKARKGKANKENSQSPDSSEIPESPDVQAPEEQPVSAAQTLAPMAYPHPQTYAYNPVPSRPLESSAIISLVVGLIGLIFCGGFLSPLAWYFGQSSRKKIRQSQGYYSGEEIATAGMVLGIVGTAVLGIFIFINLIFLILFGSAIFFSLLWS